MFVPPHIRSACLRLSWSARLALNVWCLTSKVKPCATLEGIRYTGNRKASDFKQRALKSEELKRLFQGEELQEFAANAKRVQQFWLPVLCLYTGARINEVAQINPQVDVRQEAKSGVWYLLITEDTESHEVVEKSVKTGATREAPLHRHLLELGFLEFVEKIRQTGATVLFPLWPPCCGRASVNTGKWFSRFLRKIGLHGTENEAGKALHGAHLFRHTLLTYGSKAKRNLRCISGHAELSDNPVADGYEDDTI